MKNLEDLRVVDLRNELDRRGLDKAGVKAVLIERLKKAILAEGGNPNEFELNSQSGSFNKSFEDEQKASESENVNDSQDGKELGKAESTTPKSKSNFPKKGIEVEKESPTLKTEDTKAPDAADEAMDDEEEEEEEEEESRHDKTDRERRSSQKDYSHLDDDPLDLFVEDDDKMLDYEENDMDDDGKDKDEEENDVQASDSLSKQNSKDKNISEKSSPETNQIKDEKSEKFQNASCSKNLWVSGLSSDTRAQDLKTLFSKHGKVLSAKIVTNAKTPGAKCFGFVTMSTLDDANKCINLLNHAKLQGREIQVEKAKGEQNSLKLAPNISQQSPDKKDVKTRQPITIDSLKGESSKANSADPNDKSPMNDKGKNKNKGKQVPQPASDAKNFGRDENKKGVGRGKLSVKDRVVDRRPGAPKPRIKQVPFRARRSVLIAGNSIARVVSEKRELAGQYGVDFETQCWPDEDLRTILSNLSKVVRRDHQVIIIFGLTFEAWKYVSLLENQFEPRIVFPNPSFNLDTVATEMDKFIEFCKSKNPLMKVFLVIPSIQDMYAYNRSRVEKYSPKLLPNLENSPSFNKDAMAESSRIVYGKFSKLNTEYSWLGKLTLSGSYVFNRVCRPPARKKKQTPITTFLSGKSNELSTLKALFDGLHPTDLYIDKFWSMYWRFFKPMTANPINEPPRAQNMGPRPQEFMGPGPQEFMGPGPQNFIGPGPQEFMGPGPQEFMGPGPQEFMGPGPQNFMGPGPQEFMGPGPQEFRGPGPQNFMGPGPQDCMGPGPQNFMGPGPQEFMGPGPQEFMGPGPQEFMGPGPQNFTPSRPPGMMAPFPSQPTPNDPGAFFPDNLAAQNSEKERLEQERERHRLAMKEKLLKEEEKMRKREAKELQERERRQKEETEKLKREREKLRLEREAVERQKQELLRLEREQQRMERERLEREKEELKKQQMKIEEARRGLKRPLPPDDRDRRDFFDDNKKRVNDMMVPDRRAPTRGTNLPSNRGMGGRAINRGAGMGSMMGESDLSGSTRMPDSGFNRPAGAARGSHKTPLLQGRGSQKTPLLQGRGSQKTPLLQGRGSQKTPLLQGMGSQKAPLLQGMGSQKTPLLQGSGWMGGSERDSHFERPGVDRPPLLRAANQFGDERERSNLRPDDRSLSHNMGQSQRSTFMQNQRDTPYSGGSMGGGSMGAWRKDGNTSVASKNETSDYSMNSTMMGRYMPNSSSSNMMGGNAADSRMNSGNMMGGNASNFRTGNMMGENASNSRMDSGNMMGGNASNSRTGNMMGGNASNFRSGNMMGGNASNSRIDSGNMMGGNASNSRMNSGNMMGGNASNSRMSSGNMMGGNASNSRMNSGNMMGGNASNSRMSSGNMMGGNASNSRTKSSSSMMDVMLNSGINSDNMMGGNMYDTGMNSTGMIDGNMPDYNTGGRGTDNQGNWMPSNRNFNSRWDNNTSGRGGGAMNMPEGNSYYGSGQVSGNQTQYMSDVNPGDRFRAMANFRK